MPLPPYIERHQKNATDEHQQADRQRYQTVFAKHPGAAAAPTAALHFDEDVLHSLASVGVHTASVTLHVGAGTFSPVKTEDLSEHRMHSEWYRIPAATLQAIADCRARGGRVVAVGTTSVRTWSLGRKPATPRAIRASSSRRGLSFKVVDVLITNFHLPKSTLVDAGGGVQRV
jgi:S-adenosylmethionine:tRNA ribosyltransferase-isomerase